MIIIWDEDGVSHACQKLTMGGVSDGEEGGEDGARKHDEGPNCKPGTQVGP